MYRITFKRRHTVTGHTSEGCAHFVSALRALEAIADWNKTAYEYVIVEVKYVLLPDGSTVCHNGQVI